jgi:hypothetical protein
MPFPCSHSNSKDIAALHERLVKSFLDNMTQVDLVVSYGKEGGHDGFLFFIRTNRGSASEWYKVPTSSFASHQYRWIFPEEFL